MTSITPFRCGLIGASASGKSTKLMSDLDEIYKHFDEIFVICPTLHQDLWTKALKKYNIKKDNTSTDCSNAQFNAYFDKVKEMNAKDKKKSFLIILDDCAETELYSQRSALTRAICFMRHHKCSLFLTCQGYRKIPAFVRINLSVMVIFAMPNRKELAKCEEENGGQLFLENYKKYCSKMYSCMAIDFTKNIMDPERFIQG